MFYIISYQFGEVKKKWRGLQDIRTDKIRNYDLMLVCLVNNFNSNIRVVLSFNILEEL